MTHIKYYNSPFDAAVGEHGAPDPVADIAYATLNIGDNSWPGETLPILAKRAIITVNYTGTAFDGSTPDTAMYLNLPVNVPAGYIVEFQLGFGCTAPLFVQSGFILDRHDCILRCEKLNDGPDLTNDVLWSSMRSMPSNYAPVETVIHPTT